MPRPFKHIEDQGRIVRTLKVYASEPTGHPVSPALALEILDAEQAHLDQLCELTDGGRDDADHKTAITRPSEGRSQS